MKSLIYKLWSLFDTGEKLRIFLLFLLILCGTALEILGIGAVLPFIALLNKPNLVSENIFFHRAYDWIGANSMNEFMIWGCMFLIIIFAIKNGLLASIAYIQSYFLSNKYLLLTSRLFRSYLYRPYPFHLQKNTAQLLRNLGIVSSVIQGILFPLIVIITEAMIIITVFVLLALTNFFISVLVTGTLGGFMGIFYLLIRRRLRILGEMQKYHSGQTIQQVNQGLGSIKETKILGREGFFAREYYKHLQKTVHSFRFQQIVSQMPRYYIETVTISLVLLVMIFALSTGKEPQSVLVILSLFAITALRLMPSMSRITSSMSSIRFYTASLDEVYQDLLHCEKHIRKEPKEDRPTRLGFHKQIELKTISYQYEKAREPALREISLTILKNTTVGFVGPSGAGKTTLADVFLGLLKPSKGLVLVDEKNIHQSLPSWQRMIGYVPQSIYLMDYSIKGNVAFGLPEEKIDEEKVWIALRLAQLENFVQSLPDGIKTTVGENGTRLSGGQRQRIGIARALYHGPEILVMDEATAFLDNDTERAFMEAIKKLTGEKTIVLIAHRFTTVRNCDTIYFLANGCLMDSGPYNNLISNNHKFRQMAGV